jgi:hypothetical protein
MSSALADASVPWSVRSGRESYSEMARGGLASTGQALEHPGGLGVGRHGLLSSLDPFVQAAQLVPSDTDESFQSVVVAGGYVFAAAPSTSGAGGTTQGAIFVFQAPAGGWAGVLHEVAELTPGPGVSTSDLGRSLAVSSDGGTVFAGTYASSPQAVFVFTEPGGGWAGEVHQSAELVGAQPPAGSELGFSLALDGNTLVAGDPGAGAGYVFVEPGTGWTGTIVDVAKLTGTDPTSPGGVSTEFGWTVAISGQTIVIGEAPAVANWPGVAYLYTEPSGGWRDMTQSARLTASSGVLMHQLPGAGADQVAVSGDTIAVPGALAGQPTGVSSGIFVYQKPAAGWTGSLTQSAILTSSSGASLADPVVGNGAIFAGNGSAEYAFDDPAGGWSGDQTQAATLTASDGGALGPVVVVGDQLFAGGGFDGSTAASLGSAYLFTEPPSGWSGTVHETAKLSDTGSGQDANGWPYADVFAEPASGWASEPASALLSPSGDPDPVSFASVAASGSTVVATPGQVGGDPFAPSPQGPVYVFTEPPSGWRDATQTTTLTASDGATLGAASVSGQTIVAAGGGRVYLFQAPAGGWGSANHETATLSDAHGAPLTSASVSNTTVAAGDDVFTRPTGGWAGTITQTARLAAPPGAGAAQAEAVSGDTIAVERTTATSQSSSVYIYTKPRRGWVGTVRPSATLRPRANARFADGVSLSGRVVAVSGGAAASAFSAPVTVFVEPARGWASQVRPDAVTHGDYATNEPQTTQLAVDQGHVAVITTSTSEHGSQSAGSILTITEPPANGWGRSTTPAPAVEEEAPGVAVALEPHLAFVAGPAVTVFSLHGGGPPAVSGLRTTGLVRGRPRLSFTVYKGTDSPPLSSLSVNLPAGLRFARSLGRTHHGISVQSARLHSATVTHGQLRLRLQRPAARFTLILNRPALDETKGLSRRLASAPRRRTRHPRTVRLVVRVTAIDTAASATPLRATATVREPTRRHTP